MRVLGNGNLTGGFESDCPATREILTLIGDKWSVLIVVNLRSGAVRFNELKRSIHGISQRMLTHTLRGLERDGLVERTVYPTNPPRVDYALTELGKTLLEPVSVLATWAQGKREAVQRARAAFGKSALKSKV